MKEFAKFKEEETNRWNEIISHFDHLEHLDSNLNSEMKSFLQDIRKKLEQNKNTLEHNFELQNVIKSTQPSHSKDSNLVYDSESTLKKNVRNVNNQHFDEKTKENQEISTSNRSPNGSITNE